MTPHITVRPATERDLPWLVEHDGHLGAELLARKVGQGEVLLAELDGEPAGLLRLDHLWSLVPYVTLVRVIEPYRRRGVGRALVDAACDHARQIGWGFLLSSATAGEAAPRAWHLAVGFQPCGVLTQLNDDGTDEEFYRLPV